jgi:hypothetical protein
MLFTCYKDFLVLKEFCSQALTSSHKQDQDGTSWSCLQAVSKPVWHILLLCVQWKTPDDGRRNCPKHVEFNSKNKFEKLVHLVGLIIRIYHDARSPERQIRTISFPHISQWPQYFLPSHTIEIFPFPNHLASTCISSNYPEDGVRQFLWNFGMKAPCTV